MLQPSTILAHFTFCGSQWRWMCPLHYSSFWVKWWNHVSQRYHVSRELVCSSFKWLKKRNSTCKYQFLWTSIMFLGTNHVHTLLYPSCTWTMLGTVFTNHSSAMDKSWIVSWRFFQTSPTTCTVFTCSWSANMKGVIFMMDANPLLNSLHPLPKWCGLITLSPNTSINWQWISRVEILTVTTQSFLHDQVSTIITTAHKLSPK